MGTSTGSSGPVGKVPLIPPWVPPVPAPAPKGKESDPKQSGKKPLEKLFLKLGRSPQLSKLAAPGRFRGARLNIGGYAGSIGQAGKSALQRSLGKYISVGLGGAAIASLRFAGTSKTADQFYNTLTNLQSGQANVAQLGVEPSSLAGRTAKEVIDVITEAIRPIDGTQDAEISRQAIAEATADLLEQYSGVDVDLTVLTYEQIETVIELYVAHDICLRIELDIGGTLQDVCRQLRLESFA